MTEATGLSRIWLTVQRRLPALLLISVLAGMVSWFAADRWGEQYEVQFSYLISLSDREDRGAYRFDGFYALSAINLFSETLAELVRRPEVVAEAARRAQLSDVPRDARGLRRLVVAERAAPQLVAVTVRAGDPVLSEQLARSLQKTVADNIVRYHESGEPALRFRVVASDPWVGVRKIESLVVAAATSLFVLFAAVNLLIFRESLAW